MSVHEWNFRKSRKFPVGLGSDRNDFQVETRGSERADRTELGFQHYMVLNPGDERGWFPGLKGQPDFTVT